MPPGSLPTEPAPAPPSCTVNGASTGGRTVTVMVSDARALRPPGKLARTLTRKLPSVAKRCVGVGPSALAPSPKSQCPPVGFGPVSATTPNVTSSPTRGWLVDTVIRTAGGGRPGVLGPGRGAGFFGFPLPGPGFGPSAVPSRLRGSYLATCFTPPSSRITPACSLAGSLKNTTPSRLNN